MAIATFEELRRKRKEPGAMPSFEELRQQPAAAEPDLALRTRSTRFGGTTIPMPEKAVADPNVPRLTAAESLKEVGKGLMRMPERLVAQAGNVMEWMADYKPEKSWNPAERVVGKAWKAIQPEWHSRMEEFNRDVIRKYGKKISEFWQQAAETGIEAPSEKYKQQTWGSAPVTKAFTGAFESGGSFLASLATGYVTKNPQLGIIMLSSLSGGSAYKSQTKKGVDKGIAQNIAVLTAAWEGLTEQIPFDVILNTTTKSALKRFVKGGSVEGFQEFIQGVGENLFEHFGYNLKDWKSIPDAVKKAVPHLMDNWLDNVTAGFILGGGASAVIQPSGVKLQEKLDTKETFSRKDVKELYSMDRTTAEERQNLFDAAKEAPEAAPVAELPEVDPMGQIDTTSTIPDAETTPDEGFTEADKVPEEEKVVGQEYKGGAYRSPTQNMGIPRGATAADVIRFESEELGNKQGFAHLTPEKLAELEKRPAGDLVWVSPDKKTAATYGQEDIGAETTDADIERVSDFTGDVAGGEIIAEDGDGGYLVLKKTQPPQAVTEGKAKRGTKKAKKLTADEQLQGKIDQALKNSSSKKNRALLKKLNNEKTEREKEKLSGVKRHIRHKNRRKVEAEIKNSDAFKSEQEKSDVRREEIDVGRYYVPEKLKGDVYQIIGTPKGKNETFWSNIQRMFTFDPAEGATNWEKAVQVGLSKESKGEYTSDAQIDISEFVRRVQEAAENNPLQNTLKALENSENPYDVALYTRWAMWTDGSYSQKEIDENVQLIHNQYKEFENEQERQRISKESGGEPESESGEAKEGDDFTDFLDFQKEAKGTEEVAEPKQAQPAQEKAKPKPKRGTKAAKEQRKTDLLGRPVLEGGAGGGQGQFLNKEDFKTEQEKDRINKEGDVEGQLDLLDQKPKPKGTGKGTGGAGMAAAVEGESFGKSETIPPRPEKTPAKGTAERKQMERDTYSPEVIEVLDEIQKIFAPAARAGAEVQKRIMRKRMAELAQKQAANAAGLKKHKKALNKLNAEDVLKFYDGMELGKPQSTPQLDKIAKDLRTLFDSRLDMVQALGKGYLESYNENYFGHIWEHPDKARNVIVQLLKKKPLRGQGSFLKKRVIMTIREGVEEHGLVPAFKNPIDMALAKVHEIDRFLMGSEIVADMKNTGLAKFVFGKSRGPDGWVKIKDESAFTVFMPPEIEISEAYDKHLVDNLTAFARRFGVDVERVMKLGGNKWGVAYGDKGVKTKFAGPVSVFAHEIGHVIGKRYGLLNWLTKTGSHVKGEIKKDGEENQADARRKRTVITKELRALADMRYEGSDVGKGFKKYVRKGAEKEAVLLESLIHAPEKFKEVAPTVYQAFNQFIADHEELSELHDIAPSLVIKSSKGKVFVPGTTVLGQYYVPEPAARLLNNYLSPGLRTSDNKLVAGSYDRVRRLGNLMNQANLGFSAFHGLNTTTDVIASHIGLGLRQLLATPGQRLQGLKTLAIAPISPAHTWWEGNKLMKAYEKDLNDIQDPRVREMIEALITSGGRGGLDAFYYNQAVQGFSDTFADIRRGTSKEKVKALGSMPFKAISAGLEVSAKPIMEYLVPRQKLGLFSILAQHEMERARTGQITDSQLAERLVQSWDNVDNRMGQLVYDNLFWNKKMKDFSLMMVRSVGWNVGSWREYGGAFGDMFTGLTGQRQKQGDVWLSQKIGYFAGAIITYMTLGSIIQYMLTGEPPEEQKDYFFPKTGNKNPDGSDERLSLPTYAKDWFAYSKHPITTMQHKLHPLWSSLAQMWNNEDFYGTEIRGHDDPIVQQVKDVTEYMAKQFLPFSARSYAKMRKAGSSKWKAGSTAITGIISAPASISKSPAQELMTKHIVARLPRGSRTKAQFDKSRFRKEIQQKIRKGQPIDPAEVRAAFTMKEWKSIKKSARLAPFASSFKRLTLREALDVYTISSPSERSLTKKLLIGKMRRYDRKNADYRDLRDYFRELVR